MDDVAGIAFRIIDDVTEEKNETSRPRDEETSKEWKMKKNSIILHKYLHIFQKSCNFANENYNTQEVKDE